jgi:hypothetical protein
MIPEDAFISPDEPLIKDPFRDALISPEDPFTPREEEGGMVVGMDGSSAHDVTTSGEELLNADRIVEILEAVSVGLRENRISGLRIERGTSSFETNLKNHLAEYFSKFR